MVGTPDVVNWPHGLALVRIAVYIMLAVLAVHVIRTIGTGSSTLDQWLSSGKAQHETVAKLLAQDAQDRQRAAQSAHQAMILQGQVAQASQRFEDLSAAYRAHLDSDQVHPDTAAFRRVYRACWDALTLCKARGDSLQRADSVDAFRASYLEAALQRSDSSLAAGLKVAQCKFLLVFGCLSRARSAEVGIGLGLIGGWVLFRH